MDRPLTKEDNWIEQCAQYQKNTHKNHSKTHHYPPTKMAKIKKTDNTKWWEEYLQSKWNSQVFAADNKNMVQPLGK